MTEKKKRRKWPRIAPVAKIKRFDHGYMVVVQAKGADVMEDICQIDPLELATEMVAQFCAEIRAKRPDAMMLSERDGWYLLTPVYGEGGDDEDSDDEEDEDGK